jgi:hypothetical protein
VTERHLAYVDVDLESIARGGSTRTAACRCGWRGPQRATLELATDDALTHERTSPVDRRDQLMRRIASNKAWLEKNKNFSHDYGARKSCQRNIETDEQELAKLNAQEDS